ncbi:MAG: class I SAM-dependent methyltransferase [Gammaproteobacteria bacterium]|nr:class I SAM-dependent methyltransferase [Gammaproteobacteria bacterium]
MADSLILQDCLLCEFPSNHYMTIGNRVYYKCTNCSSIFLTKECRLDETSEKDRYLEHNNDVYDERYREFVSPITNYIMKKYTRASNGLDYGSGTGPVISTVLSENDYSVSQYDPYFSPDKLVLENNYNYIVCCEVIEHFYQPKNEFTNLRNILKSNGELICKTEIYNESIEFSQWYYKNDPTHVFFYSEDTFEWIKNNIGFSQLTIEGRVVIFKK